MANLGLHTMKHELNAITQTKEPQKLFIERRDGPPTAAAQKVKRHPVLLQLQVYHMAAAGSVALAAQVLRVAGAVPPCNFDPGQHQLTVSCWPRECYCVLAGHCSNPACCMVALRATVCGWS
jgi:hypothetical protein